MKVAVLGCSGAMGAYFIRRFLADGHEVAGSDIRPGSTPPAGFSFVSSNREAVSGADAVLLAVPIRDTVNVAREVSACLKEGCVAVEMMSVKASLLGELKGVFARRRVALLSIHPLFGPLSKAPNPKIFVIGTPRDVSIARSLFPWAKLLRLEEEEHDQVVAYALSMVHLLNLAFVSTLKKGIGVDEFVRVATPMGSAQLNLAKAVLSQDPSLYSYIQLENPSAGEVISTMVEELQELNKLIASKDSQGFERRFVSLSAEFSRTELARALKRVYSASS